MIKKDPKKRLKGRYQGWLSGEGLHLQQGKGVPIVLACGEARYLGGNSLSVRHGERLLELGVVKLAGYPNRLAEDIAAYLNGDMARLPVRSYALPWYLVTLAFLPMGIPLITLGGLVPGLLGGLATGVNLMVAQREKWPTALRAALTACVAVLAYLGLGVFLWGIATNWAWFKGTPPGPPVAVGPQAGPGPQVGGNPQPGNVPPTLWVDYRLPGSRAAITMPAMAVPRREKLPGLDAEGKVFHARAGGGQWQYLFGYADRPGPEWDRIPLGQRFDDIRQGMVAAAPGSAAAEEKEVTLDNQPGREFALQRGNNPGVIRLYAARPRLYVLEASGKDLPAADVEKFFRSLRLNPQPPGLPAGVRFLQDAERDVVGVTFTGDGSCWTADASGELNRWDVAAGQVKATMRVNLQGELTALAVAPGGKTGAVSKHGEIHLIDLETEKDRGPLGKSDGFALWALAFSLDGRTLASAHGNDEVRLWDVGTASFRKALTGHKGQVSTVVFAPDGNRFASASQLIKQWSTVAEKELASAPGDDGAPGQLAGVKSLAFSPDNATLASGGNDGKLRLWNVQPFEVRSKLGEGRNITSVAFSPDGRLVAAGAFGGEVRVWEVANGKQVLSEKRKPGTNENISALVAFASDGKSLVVARANRIEVWDLTQLIRP